MSVVLLFLSMALERVVGGLLAVPIFLWNGFVRCLEVLCFRSTKARAANVRQARRAEAELLWEEHRTASTNDLLNLAARVMESGLRSRVARQ